MKKNRGDGTESRAEMIQTGNFLCGPPIHNSCQCAELLEDEQHSVWQAVELSDTTNKAKVMARPNMSKKLGHFRSHGHIKVCNNDIEFVPACREPAII